MFSQDSRQCDCCSLSIQSMVMLAPRLSDSVLNNQLLKHLAKCQLDEQPSIRTNVNICLGKIACHLNPAVSPLALLSCKKYWFLSRTTTLMLYSIVVRLDKRYWSQLSYEHLRIPSPQLVVLLSVPWLPLVATTPLET